MVMNCKKHYFCNSLYFDPSSVLLLLLLLYSGVGRCQKVGGGTQTRNLCTFGKEPIYTSGIWIYGYLITAICVSLLKLSTR